MTNRALVIGINAYGGPNELPSCVQDAESFSQLLGTQYGFNDIRALHDRQATKDNVLASLSWLFSGVQPGDQIVFFYSGHGYQPVVDGEMREALVSQDAQFIDDVDLSNAMSTTPDGVLTIVLDTCFSGGLEKVFIIDPFGQVRHTAKAKYWTPPGDTAERRRSLDTAIGYRRLGTLLASKSKGFLPSQPGATISTLTLPSSKGLLMSAAQATETASASTPETNGLSAFTYCLIDSSNTLGQGASATDLIMKAGDKLHSMNVPQTPALKQPITPPDLGKRTFVTLQPTTSAKTFDSDASARMPSSAEIPFKSETLPMPTPFFMSDMQNKGFDPSALQMDKAWYDTVASIVSTVVPAVLPAVVSAVTKKDFQPGSSGAGLPPAPSMDKAWYDTVVEAVKTVAPIVAPIALAVI